MAASGQGSDPYGHEYSYGEAENSNEGYSSYAYNTDQAQTTNAYHNSDNYNLQAQQSNVTFAQYSLPEGWQQPAHTGGKAYGGDQYGFLAGSSVQRPSTPTARGYSTGGGGFEFRSNVQHMMPDARWASRNAPSTTRYWSGSRDTPGSADMFRTGSVLPGQDEAPPLDWDHDNYVGNLAEMDLDDDLPNYTSPVNMRTLPAPVSLEEQVEEKYQTELKTKEQEIEETANEAAMRELEKEEERRRAIKASNIKALEKYRVKKSWDEIYIKEKERITRGINEKSKEILTSLQNEKRDLLRQLKQHDHEKCRCDAVHQYLFFTGESRHITREEAFKLGWLTAEELQSLQCRSPQHSPSKKSSSSGKSGSSSGSRRGGSPSGKKSDKGKGKGRDSRKGEGKGHKR
ncbi:hypothetical protein V8F20_010868 [Naviculisporaceae sp. PSN 640]